MKNVTVCFPTFFSLQTMGNYLWKEQVKQLARQRMKERKTYYVNEQPQENSGCCQKFLPKLGNTDERSSLTSNLTGLVLLLYPYCIKVRPEEVAILSGTESTDTNNLLHFQILLQKPDHQAWGIILKFWTSEYSCSVFQNDFSATNVELNEYFKQKVCREEKCELV